jgi:hypothetical protein
MKKVSIIIAVAMISASSAAYASNVGVDLNVQIGNPPPPPVIIRESPPPERIIVREEPASRIIIEDDVDFIYPSQLGFYVGVGIPYDLFFLNNFYFTYRDGYWFRAHNHRGPWVQVERRQLPPGLRKYRLEKIRYYRDHEYKAYEREHDHYRGRHVRSEKGEWKERRKAEKEYRKEDKRQDKAERKMEKQHRKEEKQWDKEDRKDDRGRHGRD